MDSRAPSSALANADEAEYKNAIQAVVSLLSTMHEDDESNYVDMAIQFLPARLREEISERIDKELGEFPASFVSLEKETNWFQVMCVFADKCGIKPNELSIRRDVVTHHRKMPPLPNNPYAVLISITSPYNRLRQFDGVRGEMFIRLKTLGNMIIAGFNDPYDHGFAVEPSIVGSNVSKLTVMISTNVHPLLLMFAVKDFGFHLQDNHIGARTRESLCRLACASFLDIEEFILSVDMTVVDNFRNSAGLTLRKTIANMGDVCYEYQYSSDLECCRFSPARDAACVRRVYRMEEGIPDVADKLLRECNMILSEKTPTVHDFHAMTQGLMTIEKICEARTGAMLCSVQVKHRRDPLKESVNLRLMTEIELPDELHKTYSKIGRKLWTNIRLGFKKLDELVDRLSFSCALDQCACLFWDVHTLEVLRQMHNLDMAGRVNLLKQVSVPNVNSMLYENKLEVSPFLYSHDQDQDLENAQRNEWVARVEVKDALNDLETYLLRSPYWETISDDTERILSSMTRKVWKKILHWRAHVHLAEHVARKYGVFKVRHASVKELAEQFSDGVRAYSAYDVKPTTTLLGPQTFLGYAVPVKDTDIYDEETFNDWEAHCSALVNMPPPTVEVWDTRAWLQENSEAPFVYWQYYDAGKQDGVPYAAGNKECPFPALPYNPKAYSLHAGAPFPALTDSQYEKIKQDTTNDPTRLYAMGVHSDLLMIIYGVRPKHPKNVWARVYASQDVKVYEIEGEIQLRPLATALADIDFVARKRTAGFDFDAVKQQWSHVAGSFSPLQDLNHATLQHAHRLLALVYYHNQSKLPLPRTSVERKQLPQYTTWIPNMTRPEFKESQLEREYIKEHCGAKERALQEAKQMAETQEFADLCCPDTMRCIPDVFKTQESFRVGLHKVTVLFDIARVEQQKAPWKIYIQGGLSAEELSVLVRAKGVEDEEFEAEEVPVPTDFFNARLRSRTRLHNKIHKEERDPFLEAKVETLLGKMLAAGTNPADARDKRKMEERKRFLKAEVQASLGSMQAGADCYNEAYGDQLDSDAVFCQCISDVENDGDLSDDVSYIVDEDACKVVKVRKLTFARSWHPYKRNKKSKRATQDQAAGAPSTPIQKKKKRSGKAPGAPKKKKRSEVGKRVSKAADALFGPRAALATRKVVGDGGQQQEDSSEEDRQDPAIESQEEPYAADSDSSGDC